MSSQLLRNKKLHQRGAEERRPVRITKQIARGTVKQEPKDARARTTKEADPHRQEEDNDDDDEH